MAPCFSTGSIAEFTLGTRLQQARVWELTPRRKTVKPLATSMTNSNRFALTGIGNAIVDVISAVPDEFIQQEGLEKGSMTLVDEARAAALYAKLPNTEEQSGGSAGNTMAGFAALGGRGAYVGKVRNDALGDAFARDIREVGVHFVTPAALTGATTARCLIAVTPDAQRTMSTFLGACVGLGPEDIDELLIASSDVTYLEGYLWDPPRAKEAFIKASNIAHEAGNQVALTLSDPFCVERHRAEFLNLVRDHVDILFANESEIQALYRRERFEDAVREVRSHCKHAVLTRSEKGAVVTDGDALCEVAAAHVAQVVDTTGAGDLFAAGFLFGYTHDAPLAECARLGAQAAAEVISHFGARPQTDLKQYVQRGAKS